MEAARVPQQLLGELFVEKGLITPGELAEALAEQKDSGKRIGQILVAMGFVSRPDLTTMLAEQLGVEFAKQEGFGAGLWSEIKRRHPRGKVDESEEYKPVEPADPPEAQDLRLALIDELNAAPSSEPDELNSLRQQLSFASTRLEEERTAHDGTRRLLEESRSELEHRRESEALAQSLSEQVEALEGELAAGVEAQIQLAAEAARREEELKTLRDEHAGSKDAIAALTTQVDHLRAAAAGARAELDELRSENEKGGRRLEKTRAEAGALEATVTELRKELAAHEAAASAHEQQLAELRREVAERKDAASREASARIAVERQLGQLQSDAQALSENLEQERAEAGKARGLLDAALEERAGMERRIAGRRAEDRKRAVAHQAELDGLHGVIAERDDALAAASVERAAMEEQLASATAELRAELSSRGEKAKQTERKVDELQAELVASDEARSREAAARAGVEAELTKLRSDARALAQNLEETRAAHVAARRDTGRLESRCAELEHELKGVRGLLEHADALDSRLQEECAAHAATRQELARMETRLGGRDLGDVDPDRHVVFMPVAGVYALAERPGPSPDVGSCEDVDEMRFVVTRTGPSPLPGDRRRCAFLEVA